MNREIVDLIKSWIVISLVFTIVQTRFSFIIFLISGATVGLGFLLHELAHKYTAQYYGCRAGFVARDEMLVISLIMAFVGFVFAAPGAVVIYGHVTRREYGIISLAGPLTNFIIAGIFFLMQMYVPFLRVAWIMGFSINSWLGLFNLMPFWMFDGKKILNWNLYVYLAMLGTGLILVFGV